MANAIARATNSQYADKPISCKRLACMAVALHTAWTASTAMRSRIGLLRNEAARYADNKAREQSNGD